MPCRSDHYLVLGARHEPVALMLSRQPLPTLDRTRYAAASGVARGAYVLADPPEGEPEVILLPTGSEIAMTVEAYAQLTADGVRARVVSMPSMQLFDQQPQAYRDDPPTVTARIAIEKSSPFGWDRWVGSTGTVIGMSTFGESAPMKVLQAKFGSRPKTSSRRPARNSDSPTPSRTGGVSRPEILLQTEE